jgi:hypothetical protein
MRFLFYLGHPAHFHLFKNTIGYLREHSHEVTIVIKSKDVLEQLLIDSKLPYINVHSPQSQKGTLGQAGSFYKRLKTIASIIRKAKPDLLAGSAAELGILGKYFRTPSYIFFEDDFEAVPRFAKIAGPTATKLVCPECCSAWKWSHKKIGHKSYHELAYLHPDHFTPDVEKVKPYFDLNRKNFILRFAQLTAYHDKGKSGITTALAQQLIDMLAPHGKIFITSERPLEPQFEQYRIQIPPLEIHHALYFADMYIGDSQTMTAEAAVLGTPALRFNDFVGELSYLEELEHTFHLTYGIRANRPDALIEKVKELLAHPNLKKEWAERRTKMLQERINLSAFMNNLLLKAI